MICAARLPVVMLAALSVLLLVGAAPVAGAQSINKCTQDGKVTYSEQPCPAGAAASTLDAPAAPPPDPNAAANLKRMQKESAALQKDRLKREAADEREAARSARIAAANKQRCDKLRLQKKWADEEVRGAVLQNEERAKTKARRLGDRLKSECPA